jgi:ABC-type antimicrobial peptide transport system permease subunit
MILVVRTANDPRTIVEAARRRVLALDKNTPIYHVETLDQFFAQSVEVPRFITALLGGFAGLALVLACLGIYGVISYTVAQRTREIGIRLAVGAKEGDVLWMVIREGLRPALAGIAIGIVGALRLTRILSSLLYGIKPADPLTFIAVALILICVALLACYLPARGAMKVDPMVALRYE